MEQNGGGVEDEAGALAFAAVFEYFNSVGIVEPELFAGVLPEAPKDSRLSFVIAKARLASACETGHITRDVLESTRFLKELRNNESAAGQAPAIDGVQENRQDQGGMGGGGGAEEELVTVDALKELLAWANTRYKTTVLDDLYDLLHEQTTSDPGSHNAREPESISGLPRKKDKAPVSGQHVKTRPSLVGSGPPPTTCGEPVAARAGWGQLSLETGVNGVRGPLAARQRAVPAEVRTAKLPPNLPAAGSGDSLHCFHCKGGLVLGFLVPCLGKCGKVFHSQCPGLSGPGLSEIFTQRCDDCLKVWSDSLAAARSSAQGRRR